MTSIACLKTAPGTETCTEKSVVWTSGFWAMLADILHTHRHADRNKCPRCVLVPLDFVTRRRGYYRHSGLVFFQFCSISAFRWAVAFARWSCGSFCGCTDCTEFSATSERSVLRVRRRWIGLQHDCSVQKKNAWLLVSGIFITWKCVKVRKFEMF